MKSVEIDSSKYIYDTYNGANRGIYLWSQTINEIDVKIPVKSEIKKSDEVKIELGNKSMKVSVHKDCNEWMIIVEGTLCWEIRWRESYWTLIPGDCIHVNLEKSEERWWDALLEHEPKLKLSDIDCSRPLEDLSEEEQMKIQELVWKEQQKRKRNEMLDILKEAWDKEGSPFKGQKFDLSKVKFMDNNEPFRM